MFHFEWMHRLSSLEEAVFWCSFMLVYTVLVVLVVGFIRGRYPRAFKGVSASIFSPLGAIFGLTATFMADEVWSNQTEALRVARQESMAVSQMWIVAAELDEPMRSQVRASVTAYVRTTLENEWPTLSTLVDPRQSRESLHSIHEITKAVASRPPEGVPNNVARAALHQELEALITSRTKRLAIALDPISHVKVVLVVTLGLALVLAVAVVHSDGWRLLIGMTVGASFIVTIMLCSVLVFKNPFRKSDAHIAPYDLYVITLDMLAPSLEKPK